MAIRFSEKDARVMGRATRGVKGITLKKNDEVIGMEILRTGAAILTVSQLGYGKRTEAGAYRVQTRGGRGLINLKITSKNGPVVGILQVVDEDELMLITQSGMIIRTTAKGKTTYIHVYDWPGASLTLEGLPGAPRKVRCLGAAAPVAFKLAGGKLVLDLSQVKPGPHATVLAVESK